MSRQKLLDWASRHRFPLLVGAVVLGFVFLYGYDRRAKPFPTWDQPPGNSSAEAKNVSNPATLPASPKSVALQPDILQVNAADPPAAQSATQPAIAKPDIERQSALAMYDPEDPGVDPKYKLPAKLSTVEAHQLILDLECLVDFANSHDQLFADYQAIYTTLTDPQVKEVLYWRIKNQVGFKEPQLPVRWREFSQASPLKFTDVLKTFYVMDRVGRIRDAIIGGQYAAGDIKFVAFATSYYADDIPKLAEWVSKAKQLNKWMIEDQVLTTDSTIKTSLDDYSNPQSLITRIRQAHAQAKATDIGLRPIANVSPSAPTEPSRSNDPIAAAAEIRRQTVARFTAAQKAEFVRNLDTVAQAVTTDVRFNPPPVKKKPNSSGGWGYMDADLEKKELGEPVVPLTHAREAYVQMREKLAARGDALSAAVSQGTLTNATELMSVYRSVMQNDISKDKEQERQLEWVIRRLKDRYNLGKSFTLGEVEDIQAAANRCNERLTFYAEQQKLMKKVLDAFRD